jgi:hypothetical protein
MTDPLSITVSIFTILQLAGTVVNRLNEIRHGPSDIKRLQNEVGSTTFLLYQLDGLSGREGKDEWSATMTSLRVPNGPLVTFENALLRLATKLTHGGTSTPAAGTPRGLKTFKNLTTAVIWPFKKEEVEKLLGVIERQKGLFSIALQNDHKRLSQAIHEEIALVHLGLAEIRQGIAAIEYGVSDIFAMQRNFIKQKVLEWLSTTDPSTNHNTACSKHEPTTGSWFTESDEFNTWYNSQKPIFMAVRNSWMRQNSPLLDHH